jgi:hypothetical protein
MAGRVTHLVVIRLGRIRKSGIWTQKRRDPTSWRHTRFWGDHFEGCLTARSRPRPNLTILCHWPHNVIHRSQTVWVTSRVDWPARLQAASTDPEKTRIKTSPEYFNFCHTGIITISSHRKSFYYMADCKLAYGVRFTALTWYCNWDWNWRQNRAHEGRFHRNLQA